MVNIPLSFILLIASKRKECFKENKIYIFKKDIETIVSMVVVTVLIYFHKHSYILHKFKIYLINVMKISDVDFFFFFFFVL